MKKPIMPVRKAPPKRAAVPEAQTPASPVERKDRYGIARRWSAKLVKDGFVPVVTAFLDHYHEMKPYDLTHSEAMFVIHLIRYKWDGAAPYPGYKALAKQMGVSHKSARRYALSLEQKGYLVRMVRQGETNQFDLSRLLLALEKCIEEKAAKSKSKRREEHRP